MEMHFYPAQVYAVKEGGVQMVLPRSLRRTRSSSCPALCPVWKQISDDVEIMIRRKVLLSGGLDFTASEEMTAD